MILSKGKFVLNRAGTANDSSRAACRAAGHHVRPAGSDGRPGPRPEPTQERDMPTGSASRRWQCHPPSRPGRAARIAALVAVAVAAGIALASGVTMAAAQGSTTGHLHQAPIGSTLPSAGELTERSRDGWELVQIVHHAAGMRNIGPNQVAAYLRRRPGG